MGAVERVSFSVAPSLLEQFDETVRRIGYEDRSKALQVAMRNFVAEYSWKDQKGRFGVGAILLTYNHRSHGLQETLTEIQHQYRDIVNSTAHVHLDESRCLEMISVRGRTERVQELARNLMKRRGVTQLKLSLVGL